MKRNVNKHYNTNPPPPTHGLQWISHALLGPQLPGTESIQQRIDCMSIPIAQPTKPTKPANPNSLLRIPKGIAKSPSPPISRGMVDACRPAESPSSTSMNGLIYGQGARYSGMDGVGRVQQRASGGAQMERQGPCRSSVNTRMLNEKKENEFIVSFLMAALGSYLVVGTNLTVHKEYLDAISDVKKIKDINWCDHVVDYLFQGINVFRSNMKKNVNIKGFFQVIFTDFAASINAPQGTPHVAHVTNEHFDALELFATNQASEDPQYDSIQIKVKEDTVYRNRGSERGELKESESAVGAQVNMEDLPTDHSQEECAAGTGHNDESLNKNKKQTKNNAEKNKEHTDSPKSDLPPILSELLSNLNEKLKCMHVQIIGTCME
uniref:Uncharacterized protein n=1 Tax=Oryza punctata TaxID=4537 RepID=A0A0E0KMU9_ORYPU